MAEIAAVAATVAVIRGALEALRGLRNSGLADEHARAVEEAMDLLRDAQDRVNGVHGELIALREENYNLRRTIENHDNWQERLAQYELVRTAGGAQVFQNGDPPNNHFACPACIENQQICVLQNMQVVSGRWQCPSCNFNYQVDPAH